ncbi:MAG: 16S rRNA (cytidine(1402)-2'-O)-methyltransferase [Pseudomonadota bacterium]
MNFEKRPLTAGLHLVGVPIGTARDITLRALDTLASADLLVAEDTRSLRKLMDIHGVKLDGRQVLSLHDHSGPGTVARVVAAARTGAVAYASEAGMPLIADPGFELVRAARAAGVPVTAAPGPTAVTTALAIAGLPTDAFFFAGFLPNAQNARRTALAELRDIPATLVFYESPKRVGKMLADAAETLGSTRQVAVCRELTKRFEEVLSGTLEDVSNHLKETTLKGEICVLIERRSPDVKEVDVNSELRRAFATMSVRDAVDAVAAAHGLKRRAVYKAALTLTQDGQDGTE